MIMISTVSLVVTVVGSILTMVPMMYHRPNAGQKATINGGGDDYYHFYTKPEYLTTRALFFYVVLVPALDIIVGLPGTMAMWLAGEDNRKKQVTGVGSVKVARMNEAERFVFILGIAMISLPYFLAPIEDPHYMYVVHDCACSFATVMAIGALVLFLQRTTAAFSPLCSMLVVLCIALGSVLDSFSGVYLHVHEPLEYGARILFNTAAAGFTILSCISLYSTVREQWSFLTSNTVAPYLLTIVLGQEACSDGLYDHLVPALHMASAMIILWITCYSRQQEQTVYDDWVMWTLIATVIVLAVEIRIHKNDVVRGLKALLDAKKEV
jgi:hypothetical protein